MDLKKMLKLNKASSAPKTEEDTAAAPKKTGRNKGKSKRKWIILGVIVVLVAALLINCTAQSRKLASTLAMSDTVVLAYADIENAIGATGTVESAESHSVYSTQSYPVRTLYVEVGDVVQEGDLLCELDSSTLEDQIEAQELSTGISAEAAAQQVKTARDAYNAAKDALDEGLNTSIISAENQVRSAYDTWQKAQRTYDSYYDSIDDETNATLIQYDNAVDTASNTYNAAKATYNSAKAARDAAKVALDAYTPITDPSNAAVVAAQTAYDGAVIDLEIKQSAFNAALSAYQTAQNGYNAEPRTVDQAQLADAKNAYDTASAALSDAQAAKQSAQQALDAAMRNPSSPQYQALLAEYNTKQTAFNSANTALDNAKNAYDTARAQRRAAYDNADTTLSDYARAVDTAYENYMAALTSLEAAQKTAETQLQSSGNSLASAQINGNTDSAVLKLAQMQEDLEETRVKANASGTVTAVYAKVGANGSGLLFMIEDTENLIVETSVKGYDVGTVKEGMAVTIKSDATGDEIFDGKISSIAPTSAKNALGQTDTSSDVLFATEVAVLSKDTGLRIGMSVRLNYIVEQQANVIAVPYDTIYENADGESCILIAEAQNNGKYLLRELPVTQGMENDLDIVITGEGVAKGLRVLSNPETYRAMIGSEITLVDLELGGANAQAFGPRFATGG